MAMMIDLEKDGIWTSLDKFGQVWGVLEIVDFFIVFFYNQIIHWLVDYYLQMFYPVILSLRAVCVSWLNWIVHCLRAQTDLLTILHKAERLKCNNVQFGSVSFSCLVGKLSQLRVVLEGWTGDSNWRCLSWESNWGTCRGKMVSGRRSSVVALN